ncbi:unnamed protein product [Somion occarium]|uniref:RING-type domain-containing protein n=1 Tax=Somion occarium TaxID=3059160 RepID=A0ABP1E4C0_9APHY
MGSRECSICLEDLKNPVVTPCGHLHCEACLLTFVERSQDAIKASCPTCRASFSLVQPDLRFIPKKFQPFIMPSIRRVYLPELERGDNQSLQNQVRDLEKRVKLLKKDKSKLMDKCESLKMERDAFAEKELEAREQNQELNDDYDDVSAELVQVKARIEDLEEDLEVQFAERNHWEQSHATLHKNYRQVIRKLEEANKELHNHKEQRRISEERLPYARCVPRARVQKRTSDQAALDSPGPSTSGASSSSAHTTPDGRAIQPIPKRPRLNQSSRSLSNSGSSFLGPPPTYYAPHPDPQPLRERMPVLTESDSEGGSFNDPPVRKVP